MSLLALIPLTILALFYGKVPLMKLEIASLSKTFPIYILLHGRGLAGILGLNYTGPSSKLYGQPTSGKH